MKFCVKCGFDISNAGAFCPGCGTPISASSAPAAAPKAAPVPVAAAAPAAATAAAAPKAPTPTAPKAATPDPIMSAQPLQPSIPLSTPTPNAARTPSASPSITDSMNYISSTGAQGFVSPDEHVIFSLKNGFGANVIGGEGWHKEDAVLTNKRLYYNDKMGVVNVTVNEDIVDVSDITCAQIMDMKPWGFIIVAILVVIAGIIGGAMAGGGAAAGIIVVALIVAIFNVAIFYALKKAFFEIDFAGGKIRFSVKQYSMEQIRSFQRSIYAAKDKLDK